MRYCTFDIMVNGMCISASAVVYISSQSSPGGAGISRCMARSWTNQRRRHGDMNIPSNNPTALRPTPMKLPTIAIVSTAVQASCWSVSPVARRNWCRPSPRCAPRVGTRPAPRRPSSDCQWCRRTQPSVRSWRSSTRRSRHRLPSRVTSALTPATTRSSGRKKGIVGRRR